MIPFSGNDRSATSTGASQLLVAANPARKGLRIGAPQSAGIWWSDTTANVSPNGVGCYWLPAGQYYEWPQDCVTSGAINVLCATASLVIPATEYL